MLIKASLFYNLEQIEKSCQGDCTTEMKVKKTHSTREKVQKKLQRKSEKLKMLHIDASQQQQCHTSCLVFIHPRKRTTAREWNGCLTFFFHLSITSSLQRQNAQPQSQWVRRLKPSSRWGKRLEAQVLVWIWRATRLSFVSPFFKFSVIYTTLCG